MAVDACLPSHGGEGDFANEGIKEMKEVFPWRSTAIPQSLCIQYACVCSEERIGPVYMLNRQKQGREGRSNIYSMLVYLRLLVSDTADLPCQSREDCKVYCLSG